MRGLCSGWGLAFGLLILTAARLVLAAWLPLTPDEAYYAVWSHHLQGGYLDHPFMVALWVRVGTWLCGDNPLGVRLLGPISVVPGSILLVQAARRLCGTQAHGVRAVWLLNATLMIGLGCATMTPDTPLVFFVTLALYALSCAVTAKERVMQCAWWGAVGGALGLGFDSKYTAILLVAAIAAAVLSSKEWRWKPAPWCAVPAFLMCIVPVVLWNANHHWASFIKQGGRTGDWHPTRALQFLGELLGGQVGLATPLIFVIFALGLRAAYQRRAEFGARILCWMALLPLGVFVQHALGDRVQANWPAVIYPVWALIGALSTVRIRWAVAAGIAIFGLVLVHAVVHLPFLAPTKDPIIRQAGGWKEFNASVLARAYALHADAIAVDDYGVAAEVKRSGTSIPIIGLDPRWHFLGQPLESFGKVLIVNDIHPNAPPDEQMCRSWQGHALRCYRVTVGPLHDVVVLP
ncbi:glycosyltransferase family 39 protein [Neokomagataea sp. TBRC 2177]|uniref:Glycosyltransferase family 39 protein n=1 Tax=Neokomagataea anthophila TaxID=2826925 RepID=A0ABS5EAU1_9PROT|nr:glycosyltransferase family 39 protein [Neokomagataea anthophila]